MVELGERRRRDPRRVGLCRRMWDSRPAQYLPPSCGGRSLQADDPYAMQRRRDPAGNQVGDRRISAAVKTGRVGAGSSLPRANHRSSCRQSTTAGARRPRL